MATPAVQIVAELAKAGVLQEVLKLLVGLFKAKEVKVVDAPRLPDDEDIKPPDVVKDKTRTMKKLVLKVKMFQYSKKLFPEQYTSSNPQGLVDNAREQEILAGNANLNRESKFYVDLTPYDQDDNPILERDVQPGEQFAGLKFKPEFHVEAGGAFTHVVGNGTNVPDTKEDSWVGVGITNYQKTNGFGCQFKVFGEGKVRVVAKLLDLESNALEFNVS